MSVKLYVNFKKKSAVSAEDKDLSSNDGILLKGNNGCSVVLIHGLTGTPNEMRFIAQSLNKEGYSVICPRLANHGAPIDVLKKTKWESFYDSARGAFVKARSEGGPVFASGLSMGALLALLLSYEFKGEISGISCLSPTLFYDGWNMPWSRCFLPLAYSTPIKHIFYFKEDPPYGIKNKKMQDLVHRQYSKTDFNNMGNVSQYGYPYFPVVLIYQLHRLVEHLKKRLKYIDVPVQLIQAKEDDMTSVKNSQFIYDRVNSRIKEIVLLNDSYHVITADQERGKVAQKMIDFFNNIRYSYAN